MKQLSLKIDGRQIAYLERPADQGSHDNRAVVFEHPMAADVSSSE